MAGSISRVLTDVRFSLLQFGRSRQALFFTLVFPGLFLVVLGYLLGFQAGPAVLYYEDQAGSQASASFLETLRDSGTVELRDGSGQDLAGMLDEGAITAYLVLPAGFGNGSLGPSLYTGRQEAGEIGAAVSHAVNQYNLRQAGGREAAVLEAVDVATPGHRSIDFLFPGILGMCIMFTAINETLSVLVRYRTSGLAQKLSATPLSTVEWNAAKLLYGTLIMLLAVIVATVVAWLAFGIRPDLNPIAVLLIVVGSLMFVGLGMIVANFVDDVKSVNAISFTITLPLMLISGSLFPVERLPVVLQFASIFSPLTCLTGGLRSAMLTGDTGTALGNLFVGAFMALVLFSVGVAILMKNDGQDM